MPGWMKAKNPGQPAVEPVKVGVKENWEGTEAPAVFDAEGDEVYGGTWGATKPSSPFPTGTVPVGEATLQKIFDEVKALREDLALKGLV